ncbi:DExH-box ATP-dependent RNA helicase DExH11, partial [Dissostichus eleginoides]
QEQGREEGWTATAEAGIQKFEEQAKACANTHSPSMPLLIIPPICQLPLLNHHGDTEGGAQRPDAVTVLMFDDMNGSSTVKGNVTS